MTTPCNSLDISQAGLVKFDGVATFTGVTTTNHDVLVGAASNGITNVSPSTSGKYLMSNGVAADPSFETISNSNLPGTGAVTLSNGTNITVTGSPLSLGGTATIAVSGPPSATTLTNHGIVLGQATSAIVATSAGTSGQLMQSKGASADPDWTTATYPATAGTSGTILQSNGTNIVNTTATYPSTSGASGNIMTSDGTNWVSSTPVVMTKTVVLTSAQIKALHATPVEIIPAPGAGKIIIPIHCTAKLNYGGNNAFVCTTNQTISLFYNSDLSYAVIDSSQPLISTVMLTTTVNRYAARMQYNGNNFGYSGLVSGLIDNVNITAYNTFPTEISGNAANDNTISISITYCIETF